MDKLKKEKQIVGLMIELYCKKKHRGQCLCSECEILLDYANERTEKCPNKEDKTFCSNCKTHCYKPEMRGKIREVMRFSGPRMILYHPITAIKHLISTKKERSKNNEN